MNAISHIFSSFKVGLRVRQFLIIFIPTKIIKSQRRHGSCDFVPIKVAVVTLLVSYVIHIIREHYTVLIIEYRFDP